MMLALALTLSGLVLPTWQNTVNIFPPTVVHAGQVQVTITAAYLQGGEETP